MNIRGITTAARFANRAAARVEMLLRRGRVKVVSIRCRQCDQWVKPNQWHPFYAMCDLCTWRTPAATLDAIRAHGGYHRSDWGDVR